MRGGVGSRFRVVPRTLSLARTKAVSEPAAVPDSASASAYAFAPLAPRPSSSGPTQGDSEAQACHPESPAEARARAPSQTRADRWQSDAAAHPPIVRRPAVRQLAHRWRGLCESSLPCAIRIRDEFCVRQREEGTTGGVVVVGKWYLTEWGKGSVKLEQPNIRVLRG